MNSEAVFNIVLQHISICVDFVCKIASFLFFGIIFESFCCFECELMSKLFYFLTKNSKSCTKIYEKIMHNRVTKFLD